MTKRWPICMILTTGLLVAWIIPASGQQQVEPEQIQIGISTDTVGLGSDFSGTTIAVFGTVENANRLAQTLNEYAVVVVVRGPLENNVIRRKERVAGIWVNRSTRTYRNVPSFYALAADRSLERIADQQKLSELELGIGNIALKLFSRGTESSIVPAPEFADQLRNIRMARSLFSEDLKGVEFLGTSLFRATLAIPADVPVGKHTVTAYLFREGVLLAEREGSFRVQKEGLEKQLYNFAHNQSFLYGVFAVLLALATGWLASIVFGTTRK